MVYRVLLLDLSPKPPEQGFAHITSGLQKESRPAASRSAFSLIPYSCFLICGFLICPEGGDLEKKNFRAGFLGELNVCNYARGVFGRRNAC